MPPNHFESEVESFLEGSHGDRTHIKRADHPRLHHYAGRYLGVSRVEFLGCSGACCYKRRQSEGFFAENGGFGRRLTMFVTGALAG